LGPLILRLSRWIAAGLGTGYAPVAPGTVASAAAVAAGAALFAVSPWALAAAALAATIGGYAAIVRLNPRDDPGWVVIDEFAGQWLALLALPQLSWIGCLLAFLLFRLFDITKPGPVGWADRQHSPFGIMADDVIAGLIAAALLAALRLIHPVWLVS
jgi:phosphatidylglycerophosphatase A